MKKYIFIIWYLLGFGTANSQQENVLCSPQKNVLWIADSNNIPSVVTNADGTVVLTFADQYITNIFANYTIYDFYQTNPNSSPVLEEFFTIAYNSKDLIIDVTANVPIDIINVQYHYNSYSETITSAISQDLIDALDGNTYEISKFLSTSDADPCFNCPLIDVSSDFNFEVSFYYDQTTDLLYMQNTELTSCGNLITIALAGGNPTDFPNTGHTLQLWESDPGIRNETDLSQYCHGMETLIYSLFDISCYNQGAGNIETIINAAEETIQFHRANVIFGYDTIEFSRVSLSIDDHNDAQMRPFTTEGNPYLQISNFDPQNSIGIEILDISGQSIFKTNRFESNSINISNFSKGLYFIKVSLSDHQEHVFKHILY